MRGKKKFPIEPADGAIGPFIGHELFAFQKFNSKSGWIFIGLVHLKEAIKEALLYHLDRMLE